MNARMDDVCELTDRVNAHTWCVSQEECDGVWSLPLFSHSFCERLVEEGSAFMSCMQQQAEAAPLQESLTVRRGAAVLDLMGLSWLNDWLLAV